MANMNNAHRRALKMLADIPENGNLDISEFEDQDVWLGMGLAVGRGHAVYRGDWCFRITPSGRASLSEER